MFERFKQTHSIGIFVAIWSLVMIMVGTIITLFLRLRFDYPFWKLFLLCQIGTNLCTLFSAGTGYTLAYAMKKKRGIVPLLLITIGTLIAAAMASLINYYITEYLFNISLFPSLGDYAMKLLVPILLITGIITLITTSIENLRGERKDLSSALTAIQGAPEKNGGLAVKEKRDHHIIGFKDIIYISSHGKKTVIHTDERDFEISQLIKEIEEKLPVDSFLRIHKQYIVNIGRVKRIQYYSGGRYTAFLDDLDESALPVGRMFAQAVKDCLRINP